MLWDFETRGVARVLCGGHAANVAAVAWSHNGRRVVSAGADGALNVWDVLTGEAVATAKLASKPVRSSADPGRAAARAVFRRFLPPPWFGFCVLVQCVCGCADGCAAAARR